MPLQPIPPAIDQTVAVNLATAMDAITDDLKAFNINLTKEERSEATTVGDVRLAFMTDYYGNKGDYPTLKPSFMDETAADRHWEVAGLIRTLVSKAELLSELIEDIKLNSEHHAYQFGLEGYATVQRGKDQNVPGADTFHDLLKKHFENLGSGGTPPQNP